MLRLHGALLHHLTVPVGIGVAVGVSAVTEQADVLLRIGDSSRGVLVERSFVVEDGIVGSTQEVERSRRAGPRDGTRVVDFGLAALLTFLGGNQDDTVGSLHTVDGR